MISNSEGAVIERSVKSPLPGDVCALDASTNSDVAAAVDGLDLACAKTARLSLRAARALGIASKVSNSTSDALSNAIANDITPLSAHPKNIHARLFRDQKTAVRAQAAAIVYVARAVDALNACAERIWRTLAVVHCRHNELDAPVQSDDGGITHDLRNDSNERRQEFTVAASVSPSLAARIEAFRSEFRNPRPAEGKVNLMSNFIAKIIADEDDLDISLAEMRMPPSSGLRHRLFRKRAVEFGSFFPVFE